MRRRTSLSDMTSTSRRHSKNDTVLVDTSALLALGAPRDQYHTRAVALARAYFGTGGRMVGTTLVLAEFHALALHRQGSDAAREGLRRLSEDPGYEWRDVPVELVRDATDAWLARFADQAFSLTDAVSFEIMRREKISTAFAFDRHFVTAGFELLA